MRLTKKPRIAVHGWQPVSAAHFWASAVVSWLVDDRHNVAQAESEAKRETVSNWWSELSTTRLNDSKQSAIIVVIMQRLHESDVSGTILSGDEDWCHLMIPMEYDWRRHCSTLLGWNDPRGLDDDGIPLVENGLAHQVVWGNGTPLLADRADDAALRPRVIRGQLVLVREHFIVLRHRGELALRHHVHHLVAARLELPDQFRHRPFERAG